MTVSLDRKELEDVVAALRQRDGSPEPEGSSGDTGFERKILTSHRRIGLRTWSGQR